ncbi:hypothetical protein [Ammoniphilus sp. YIM 78166]|uniref:hypothetical protein n=1 Tax=Ammoniphilus sp. YIM 78166 TaxID=1644106 RepID=UPI00106F8A14|nr:hypothetical protein [Ammoniphilus sp. YIM 78166]
MFRLLLGVLLAISVLSGCSQQNGTASYPSVVIWNNTQYGLSVEEVPSQQIGKQIGEVMKNSHPMPKENNEANDTSVGSKLYEISGKDSEDAIAVERDGKYLLATKNGLLNNK